MEDNYRRFMMDVHHSIPRKKSSMISNLKRFWIPVFACLRGYPKYLIFEDWILVIGIWLLVI
jgi:hypothetical protein